MPLSSEMVRLWFFAGRCPPPPREVRLADVVAWAARSECLFAALRHWRGNPALDEIIALGFAPLQLPEALRTQAGADDVRLFERHR